MEITRTTAGHNLWVELQRSKGLDAYQALDEVQCRIQVRTTPANEPDAIRVETKLDDGPWVDEGIYLK